MTSFYEDKLREMEEKHLYRSLRTLEPAGPNRRRLDGREVLLFCGNDYLGLSEHPRVRRAMAEAALAEGAGAGAARLISGGAPVHRALEEKIASFKRKERALLYSAGYLANLGALSALAGMEDVIILDKLSHASLIDGARLSGAKMRVFPHKNYERCEELLQQAAGFQRRFLVTDSVFSMDGDQADLKVLIALKQKYDALLVVDDAHGTGVIGSQGRGVSEDSEIAAGIDVITGTLSKAVGCLGGFVAASRPLVDFCVNFSRPFIFATALPPAVAAACLESFCVMEETPELRELLLRNVSDLRAGLEKVGLELAPTESPILPVLLGDEKRALEAAAGLLEQGFLVPAIRYPTVGKGKARLRVTVNSLHTGADVQALLKAFETIKRREFSGKL